jgi:hypothetical protein
LASGQSDLAAARGNGVNRHTVALCARKFLQFGLRWESCPDPARVVALRMTPSCGSNIAPARNRRSWVTPMNSGPRRCCNNTCASSAPSPVTPACLGSVVPGCI